MWKSVLGVFNTAAIFTNIALVSYRTDLVIDFFDDADSDDIMIRTVFFFVMCIALSALMIVLRMGISNQSALTNDAVSRQEQCQNLVTLLTKNDTLSVGHAMRVSEAFP